MAVQSISSFVRSNEKAFVFHHGTGWFGAFFRKKESPQIECFAEIAAKGYYDLLLEGKYQEFVAGYQQRNRIPKGYQEQLLLNAQMFVEQQKEDHKGMKSVDIISAKADTAHHVADVFLSLAYGDSTKEQIVVPMVQVDGDWKMR